MLTTRSGAYISRFGDFCVHDDNNDNNDNDDTTDHFTPAHARGVIIIIVFVRLNKVQAIMSQKNLLDQSLYHDML